MIYEVEFISQAFLWRRTVGSNREMTSGAKATPETLLLKLGTPTLSRGSRLTPKGSGPPFSPPDLVPPKRTILSPTIQQHWRRRGHGPFPFGSIFFQVNDTEEKFKWRFSTCSSRYPLHCTPHLLRIMLFFYTPPPWHPVPSPLKAVLFTRVKLPEVMEVPIQPCVIATKNVQLPIVANWKERGVSIVWGQCGGTGTQQGPDRHSQAEWLRRPSGSTGVGGQSSQASVLVSKTRMRLQ